MTEQEIFILNYIKNNTSADCLNQDFHDQFFNKFGGTRRCKYWGAQPVIRKAQSLLSSLHRQGFLKRVRISLGGNWQPGFPKHVFSYSLHELINKPEVLDAILDMQKLSKDFLYDLLGVKT